MSSGVKQDKAVEKSLPYYLPGLRHIVLRETSIAGWVARRVSDVRAINRLQQLAANLLEIPKDAVYDVPRLTLVGGLQILIENHKGILEFTDSQIRLAHATGELHVVGKRLIIRNIQPNEILIEGEIKGITYV
jgi:sporulation protein YqfC